MTATEFWLTYQLASRCKQEPTVQLIELDEKFLDVEDILDHVFRQGYVEPKLRPCARWERQDGQRVKACHLVEDLLEHGVGKTPETALKLVVDDVPTVLWFKYVYLHGHGHHTSHLGATQRIKLSEDPVKFERLANITNYIFDQGFLAAKFRSVVHWEKSCGSRIGENVCVNVLLLEGQGGCEDKPLRLVIDPTPSCHVGCHCHRCT